MTHAGAADRLNAALADRYAIERELGQGGMATVYLAHDLRHHRKVALKVLRPELAAVIGAERFLHEITTTANLQHPHILGLFDSGQIDGTVFYVMPFVDGESLRDRLTRVKQLPVEEAVRITREVASALDYAHRQGVIHRDIKPENILLHDGAALVADFGIALAASRTGGTRMTETGMSLGTPHYMSPEQAMGERTLDARTDVYALGCVLYEMLAGEPPFTGPTPQAILARVVTETPRSLSLLRHTVTPELDAAVAKALEKLPADRYATAAELAAALISGPAGWSRATHASTTYGAAPTRRTTLLLAGLSLMLAGLAIWGWLRPRPAARLSRFAVQLEDIFTGSDDMPAISPDGRLLVYSSLDASLVFRDPAAFGSKPLPGRGYSWAPFFSPDGSTMGYLTGFPGDLRLLTLSTGATITLVRDSTLAYGGSWSDDGWIYYTVGEGRRLMRIRPGGAPAELVLQADSTRDEFAFRVPRALPGGRGLLVTVWRRRGQPDVAVIQPGEPPRVVTQGLSATYLPTGHLVVVRGNGAVTAARFSLDDLTVRGQMVELITDVKISAGGTTFFAVSPTGTVLYLTSHGKATRLVRVDRTGRSEVVDPAWAGDLGWPSLSPDGTRMAVASVVDGRREVWVKQLPSGPFFRVAAAGSQNYRPFWSPDGRWVGFTSDANGLRGVFRIAPDGSGNPELIHRYHRSVDEGHWSPDGRWFVFRAGSGSSRDILGLRLGADTVPVPLVVTGDEEYAPALSPDGRWLAFGSLASGREEIFVRPMAAGGRTQASVAGGTEPLWSHDGRELYYRSRDRDLVALTLAPGPEFRVLSRRVLFSTRDYHSDTRHHAYAVGRDGSFYFFRQTDQQGQSAVLIQNWLEELKERVP